MRLDRELTIGVNVVLCVFFILSFFLCLFTFERDRQSVSRGGAERERKTHNLKQDSGSELSAQSLTWGSNSGAVRSRPEPRPPRRTAETLYLLGDLSSGQFRGCCLHPSSTDVR